MLTSSYPMFYLCQWATPTYLYCSMIQNRRTVCFRVNNKKQLRFFFSSSKQNIFNSYLSVPEQMQDFHEIRSKLKYSKLRFNYDAATKYPKYFGWLVDRGIHSGEVRLR